jgi:hypothetical protein
MNPECLTDFCVPGGRKHIPNSFLRINGVAQLLANCDVIEGEEIIGTSFSPHNMPQETLSQTASLILESAIAHHARASDSHLNTKPSTARGTDGG